MSRLPLKVHRAQWTFHELQELFRFKGDLDLRRLVMAGDIRPAMHFARTLQPVTLQAGLPVVNANEETRVDGWLFMAQEYATQVDNFELWFSILRDRPQHEEEARYFALPEPLTLTQVLALSVVFDGNVRAIEASRNDDPSRELSRKEEKTRDKLIAALACAYLGWRPWEPGRDFELAGFLSTAGELGLAMSRNCVKEHLQLAWERSNPDTEK